MQRAGRPSGTADAPVLDKPEETDGGPDLKRFGWNTDTAELRAEVRRAVAAWRGLHRQGTHEQMVAALWPAFPYLGFDVVLRGFLTALDLHDAKVTTGSAR